MLDRVFELLYLLMFLFITTLLRFTLGLRFTGLGIDLTTVILLLILILPLPARCFVGLLDRGNFR